MRVRYSGSFLGVKGTEWRVAILQDADEAFGTVGDLVFLSGSEVEIEWMRRDKEEVVCGSTATITLLSPGDRTYADLYAIAPGSIRLEIYRCGEMYWSGLLDPELYDEPYAYGSAYAVTLTFSDFGILDRLKYNLTGIRTVREVLSDALARSGLPYTSVIDGNVSIKVPGYPDTPALDSLAVRSENWTDEDGETASLKDAVEGMLQPLGLKLVQKAGGVYVYDLNGLYEAGQGVEIVWSGVDQRLGVDKVANNVRILFSSYAGDNLMSGSDIVDTGGDSADDVNLKDSASLDGKNCFTYYKGLSSMADSDSLSFTIFIHREGNLPYLHKNAGYFHILPLLDGEESVGVVNWFYSGSDKIDGGQNRRQPSILAVPNGDALFRTERIFLPGLSRTGGRAPLLRLRLEMMMDARYNPFELNDVESEMAEKFKEHISGVTIPVQIRLLDEGGVVKEYYSTGARSSSTTGPLSSRLGGWLSSEKTIDLAYYDRSGGEAVGGWRVNKHNISVRDDCPPSLKTLEDGEYIPYPVQGGYLDVTVYNSVGLAITGNPFGKKVSDEEAVRRLKASIRWMLFKKPTVELINDDARRQPVSSDDIEYAGVVNADAKDGIEIDTVCGTMEGCNPAARGLYYTPDGGIVGKLTRGGRTEHPEQLLIGTLCSQYAGRKTVLSGTARLCGEGLRWLGDAAQGDKRFMLLSELQNLREEESVIEAAEFRPDEYKSNEE